MPKRRFLQPKQNLCNSTVYRQTKENLSDYGSMSGKIVLLHSAFEAKSKGVYGHLVFFEEVFETFFRGKR